MIAAQPLPVRRRRWWRWGAVAGLFVAAVLAVVAALAGFFASDPLTFFQPKGRARPVTALYFSGDMGLRFGMGPYTAAALARHGIAVTGFSSPAFFRTHRSRAEVDSVVAQAVREALARAPQTRLVLIGQSFGADILETGLADLPAELRPRVAAVVLVVPGTDVYFRADPSSLAYRGAPDSRGQSTVNTITWTPLTCIYGAQEGDSLCPAVRLPAATVIRMPGGHFLANDHAGLVGHVLAAVRRAAPAAFHRKGDPSRA